MASTIAFLELPVCLPGLEDEKGGHRNEDRIVPGRFIPSTIIAYHESYFTERTLIYLNNGQPFLIEMTVKVFEKAIQDYIKLVMSQQNGKIIKN